MTHPYFRDTGLPRVLAHRGLVTADAAAHGVVDNSFAALAAAQAAGAVYVESDCHLTADGVVVLAHDNDLLRLTGDARKIADIPIAELERALADRGGAVTLQQALEAFPTLRFNLDVKAERTAEPVGRIVAPHAHRVLLTSFSDRRRLEALRAAERAGADPSPATSAGSATIARVLLALATGCDRLLRQTLRGVDALQIPERQGIVQVLSPRLIAAAHRHEVEIHVWTVNDAAEMRRLLALGVDGLVTDRADLALALIDPPRP